MRSAARLPRTAAQTSAEQGLRVLAAARGRLAVTLTLATVAVYFGFILLVAYGKALLAVHVAPGLSLGVLLGALVIVLSWIFTWIYVRWANRRYDVELHRLRGDLG